MKYYVIYVVNGALQAEKITEWDNLDSAKVSYFGTCKNLANEKSVIKATVKILDEQLDKVDKYEEIITHPEPTPEPEVVATPTPEQAVEPEQA